MKEIDNIEILKRLAIQAEKLTPEQVTDNKHYRQAYKQIAAGCGLLWRLLDQNKGGDDRGKAVLK